MIIFKDDFFNADLCKLIAKGVEAYEWRYWCAVPPNNKTFVSFLWNNQSSEDNFFSMLWKKIQKELPIVQDCYCDSVHANGTVKGQNINWHTDHSDKTVLYFPLAWDREWGGSIYVKNGNSTNEIRYHQNRLVVFDRTVSHSGSGPSIENILRVSIAFSLRLKTSKSQGAAPEAIV